MRPFVAAVAFTFALASPVSAQERMTASLCEGSWLAFANFSNWGRTEVEVRATDDGWCEVSDGQVEIAPQVRFSIGTLRWRGSDFQRLVDQGLPPRQIKLEARGLYVRPQTGDRVLDYLMRVQQEARPGLGLDFDLRWDAVQSALFVDHARVEFDASNYMTLEARIDGVDLSDQAAIGTTLGRAGLRSATIEAEFNGWFEQYMALALGDALIPAESADPASDVAQMRAGATAWIDSLPEGFMAPRSREALAEFVDSLPHPRGAMTAQLNAEPVLGAGALAPLILNGVAGSGDGVIETVLTNLSVLFIWTPKEGEE